MGKDRLLDLLHVHYDTDIDMILVDDATNQFARLHPRKIELA